MRGGNPWIFSGAIASFEPASTEPGSFVEVRDADGTSLGCGYCNPATTIAVRMLWWGGTPSLDEIIARRIASAIQFRSRVIDPDTNCYRLINGDGDGFSGVVVDRYADVFVAQFLTAGAERMRDAIVARLESELHPRAIFERSQGAVRRQEGLEDRVGAIMGALPDELIATENGIKIVVDPEIGQKTGYFLDQRENRVRLLAMAAGARVLDAYSYAGGFALAALAGGATEVVAVETSARAIEWAKRNLALNHPQDGAIEFVRDEAANYMAGVARKFDIVILDPPPLARSRKDVARATHLYVDLNAHAISCLAPGGRLMTFSCSAHLRGEDFFRAVAMGAAKARRNLRMVEKLGPGPDHPVLLGHAEGEYLTGALLADL